MNTGDKLYYLSQDHNDICSNIMHGIVDILFPKLIIVDGCVLVESIGADKIYQNRRAKGLSPMEAQSWANMFELTETLAIDVEAALKLAKVIQYCWEKSMASLEIDLKHAARILSDMELGEVYVVIDQRV